MVNPLQYCFIILSSLHNCAGLLGKWKYTDPGWIEKRKPNVHEIISVIIVLILFKVSINRLYATKELGLTALIASDYARSLKPKDVMVGSIAIGFIPQIFCYGVMGALGIWFGVKFGE